MHVEPSFVLYALLLDQGYCLRAYILYSWNLLNLLSWKWGGGSRLFSTTGSHRSQGHEFCTLQSLLLHQGFFFKSDACHGSQGPEFCTHVVLN